MKTKAMQHQVEGCRRLAAAPQYFALGAEQGTGKTWMLLADAERQYESNSINALFIIAPNGVHINWIVREIPTHLSVPHRAEFWLSGANKAKTAALRSLLVPSEELTICAMNVDAVNAKSGMSYAKEFLSTYRTMLIVDESQRIKNPSALRTKRIIELGGAAVSRRIASGTLVSNSPLDLFSQYEFLAPGLLGTRSFRAFTAEYAELLPPGHPLLAHIGGRGHPQIVKRDKDGRPIFRNTDKLARLMSPHTFRVTKDQCLDLPAKIYQTHYFDLPPKHQRAYNELKRELRFEREDGQIDVFTALTIINKLRTVTSGFILVDGEPQQLDATQRMNALTDLIEDAAGQIIVWASFREELRQLAIELKEHGVVTYHGGTSQKDREHAVDDFQSGKARIFIGNPAAAGVGLTLTAAQTVIYYSCSYSLEERLQSEDRCHRIGTRHSVLYIDMVARGTIDEKIAQSLQAKQSIAAQIVDSL